MEVKKRVSYPLGMFDLVKGFGMLFVVAFHTISFVDLSPLVSGVVWLFSTFLMACFFAVSGFQLRPVPTKQVVKKYAKTYLPMYFQLAAAVWLFCLFFRINSLKMYIPAFLLGIFFPRTMGPVFVGGIGLGWFLLALFWGSILLELVLKINNRYIRTFCVFASGFLGLHMGHAQIDYLSLYRGFSALPAMYTGYYLFANDGLSMNASGWKKWIPYLLLLTTVPVIFTETEAVWVVAALIVGEVFWGYAALCFSRDTVKCSGTLLELIRKVGRYTPWIIIIHGLEMTCFHWERVAEMLRFVPIGDIQYLVLLLLRGGMICVGCVIVGKISRIEKQWKRKRRQKKRAQKRTTTLAASEKNV